MKILAVNRQPACWPREAAMSLASDVQTLAQPLPVDCLPDCAAVRIGTPLFVPDFAMEWELEVCPAVIIDRLGKWIAPQFAGRYISGMTAAVRLVPPADVAPRWATATSFEGAVHIGAPLPVDGELQQLQMTLCANCTEETTLSEEGELHLADTIALLSRFMMLKTGDVVLPCSSGIRFPVPKPTRGITNRITISLNSTEVVNLKIK